mmetsp:Transcript_51550/g.95367  ORF Transcript_51550/g.95367 Transcript_51550/m.95367 type:complete len:438 (-) Transcript_51550:67-1380(-)
MQGPYESGRSRSSSNLDLHALDSVQADPELVRMWQQFDADGSGAINVKEFLDALEEVLGFKPSQAAVESILSEIDFDGSGAIEFEEFCHFFDKINDLDEFRRKREFKTRASVCFIATLILTSLLAFFTTVMLDITTPSSQRDTDRFSAIKTLELISGIILAITVSQAIVLPLLMWKCKLLLPWVWRFLRWVDPRRKKKKKTTNVEVSADVARKIAQNRRLKAIEKKVAIAKVKRERVQPAERISTYRPGSALTDITQPQPAACVASPLAGLPEAQTSQLRPAALPSSPAGAPPSTPPLLETRAGSKDVGDLVREQSSLRTPSKAASQTVSAVSKPPSAVGAPRVLHYPIKPENTWAVEMYGPERYAWMHDVQRNYVKAPQGFHGINQKTKEEGPAAGRPQDGVVDGRKFDTGDHFSRAHRVTTIDGRDSARNSEYSS